MDDLKILARILALSAKAYRCPDWQAETPETLAMLREAVRLTEPWLRRVEEEVVRRGGEVQSSVGRQMDGVNGGRDGLLRRLPKILGLCARMLREEGREGGRALGMLEMVHEMVAGRLKVAKRDVKRLEHGLEGKHKRRRTREKRGEMDAAAEREMGVPGEGLGGETVGADAIVGGEPGGERDAGSERSRRAANAENEGEESAGPPGSSGASQDEAEVVDDDHGSRQKGHSGQSAPAKTSPSAHPGAGIAAVQPGGEQKSSQHGAKGGSQREASPVGSQRPSLRPSSRRSADRRSFRAAKTTATSSAARTSPSPTCSAESSSKCPSEQATVGEASNASVRTSTWKGKRPDAGHGREVSSEVDVRGTALPRKCHHSSSQASSQCSSGAWPCEVESDGAGGKRVMNGHVHKSAGGC